MAIGVAVRKITVAVGVAISIGEAVAIGIAVSIRVTIAVGEAIPVSITICVAVRRMSRQIPIGMLPCPRSWQIFVIRSIEINRILYVIMLELYSNVSLTVRTSSFVIGRPFAWKERTCAFLTGFSLSLNHLVSRPIFDTSPKTYHPKCPSPELSSGSSSPNVISCSGIVNH